MEKFILSTDSCCDELKSNLKKDKISFIPMSYISDEEIYEDHFDSLQEYKNFYDEMKKGKVFSTTGLNHFQMQEYFEKLLEENKKDIIHITLSSGLSCTYQVTKDVADEINKTSKYKFYILDSLSATQGQNFLLNYAKRLRDNGKEAKSAFEEMEGIVKRIDAYFFLSDLEALKRGGRINGAQAVMAKIMQLSPILRFNSKGELEVVEKVIGVKKAIRSLFDKYSENVTPNHDMPIYLTFAGDFDSASELRTLIEEKTGITNIIIKPVGPVVSSHTGPALTGITYLRKNNKK